MSGVQSQQSAEARGAPNLNTNGEAIAMCFSGGKDSSLALWETHRARRYVVRSFLTRVNADFDRVSMHGVRRSLLDLFGFPASRCSSHKFDLRR